MKYCIYADTPQGKRYTLCGDGWFYTKSQAEEHGKATLLFDYVEEAVGAMTVLTARGNADGKHVDLFLFDGVVLQMGEVETDDDDDDEYEHD